MTNVKTKSKSLAAALALATLVFGGAEEEASAIAAADEVANRADTLRLSAEPRVSDPRLYRHGRNEGARRNLVSAKRNALGKRGDDARRRPRSNYNGGGNNPRRVEPPPSSSVSTSTERRRLRDSNGNAAPGCGPTPGTVHSPYLGCHADRVNDRAFPHELGRRGRGAVDCERECTRLGYRYFGREFKGQCFCGGDLASITRHGVEGGCDCCGGNVGPGRFCVWEVSFLFLCA